jgi:transposase
MGNTLGQRRDFEALEQRRFEAINLCNQGLSQSEISRRLNVVRQTISRWMKDYRQKGQEALRKAGRAGRRPRLDSGQRDRLRELLTNARAQEHVDQGAWTARRVAGLIEVEFGVKYHPGHVAKLMADLDREREKPRAFHATNGQH